MSQRLLDYTNKDYASLRTAMLDIAAQLLPEWTDQSPNDVGVTLLELLAFMGDSLFYNQDRIAGESFLETAVERRSIVQLLRLIGYELRPPLAASADLTLLFSPDATGPVTIPTGAVFKTTANVSGGVPIGFRYIVPKSFTIDRSTLPVGVVDATGTLKMLPPLAPLPSSLPAGSTGYLVYQPLRVVQVDTSVSNEIVASSDGTSTQRYPLARSPIIDDTLVVSVDEGSGPLPWTRVASLLNSANTDTSYTIRRDENGVVSVEFGDGTFGKIPRRGLNNITASYGVGGGAKGNVPAGSITKVVTSVDKLKAVLNAAPASGGTEAEATADAVTRGPQQFRSMGRAVTASDYQALAMGFGVGKARATSTEWNNIQLVVAPAGGGVASESLKQDLQVFLDSKRMMTTIVQIANPSYVPVVIDATVIVQPQFSLQLVQQAVQDAIGQLLAFDNVDFGQTVFMSKVNEVIQEINGVLGVTVWSFGRQDTFNPQCPIQNNGQLLFSAALGEIPVWAGFALVPASTLPFASPDGTNHLEMSNKVV